VKILVLGITKLTAVIKVQFSQTDGVERSQAVSRVKVFCLFVLIHRQIWLASVPDFGVNELTAPSQLTKSLSISKHATTAGMLVSVLGFKDQFQVLVLAR